MLPEQQQRIMGYFIEEAKDHLNTIEQGLLNLQTTIRDPEKANEVFRAAHSVKGGAAMLGIESIQKTAHRMEDYFKVLKESSPVVDRTLETMFLRVSDGLKDLLEQLEGPFGLTQEKAQEIMTGVEPVFGQLDDHLATLLAQSDSHAASISNTDDSAKDSTLHDSFKRDVGALLRQMLSAFKQVDTPESRKTLQAVCLQLSEIGEQFELAAWCDLVETARLATTNLENSYRTLAPILIKDIKAGQDLVLSGRSSEVAVSDAMQSLLAEDILETVKEESDVPDLVTSDLSDSFLDSSVPESEDIEDLFDLSEDASELDHKDGLDVDADLADEELSSDQPLIESDKFNALAESNGLSEALLSEKVDAGSLDEGDADGLSLDLDFDEIPIELSTLNRKQDSNDKADESLDALLATVSVTGPEVGAEELHSLADLFDGDLDELDNTLGGHPFVTEEMRLHPEKIDLPRADDLTDLLSEDSSELLSVAPTLAGSEHDDDLFGGTLSGGEFADGDRLAFSELDAVTEDMSELSPEISSQSISAIDALSEDIWAESDSNPIREDHINEDDNLFGDADDLFAEAEAASGITVGHGAQEELARGLAVEDSLEPDFADLVDFGSEESSEELLKDSDADLEAGEIDFAASTISRQSEAENELLGTKDIPLEESLTGQLLMQPAELQADEVTAGFLANESVSPSEPEIEFPTLTGEERQAAEADIDSFFLDAFPDPSQVDNSEPNDSQTDNSQSEASHTVQLDGQAKNLVTPDMDSSESASEVDGSVSDLLVELHIERTSEEPKQLLANRDEGITQNGIVQETETQKDALSQDVWAAFEDSSESPIGEWVGERIDADAKAKKSDQSKEIAIEDKATLEESLSFESSRTLTKESAEDFDFDDFVDDEVASGEVFPFEDFAKREDAQPEADLSTLLGETEVKLSTDEEKGLPTTNHSANIESDENACSSDLSGTENIGDEFDDFLDFEETNFFDDLEGNDVLSSSTILNSRQPKDNAAESDGLLTDSTFLDLDADACNATATETASGDEDAAGFEDATAFNIEGLVRDDSSAEELEEFNNQVEQAELNDLLEESGDEGAPSDFDGLDALLSEENSLPTLTGAATQAGDSDRTQVSSESDALDDDEDFGDLERLLEDGGTDAPAPTSSKKRPAQRPARRAAAVREQNMRVPVKHLDNLSNLVGELVVNRNTLERDQERLRQFLDNLLFQVQQLNDVGQRMRDLYERSLLESSLMSSRQVHSMPSPVDEDAAVDHATGETFDALEMDRFTGFHSLSQEMIELIVRVRESASDIGYTVESSDQVTRQFRQITTQLQEGLNTARMVAFSQAADRLPRAVRDISLKCGKEARLIVDGQDTLIDKMIVEHLYDPLTHLVNNAITHGIETPEIRQAAGKPPEGTITMKAFYQGNQTVIYVADDGGGINPEFVQKKAIEKHLISQAEAKQLSDIETYELLFHAGFSTRDKADDFAGRGVGMDVVRTSLAEIRGAITIDSEMGKGTSFTIRLPLTLSISKALSCVSNQARIAFPMDGVEDMLDVPRDRIVKNDEGQDCVRWRDAVLPFQPVTNLLNFNRTLGRSRVYGGSREDDVLSVIVLRSANTYVAVQVDQVIGEEEIVIKQLEGPVPKPLGIAGATVLGDGRVMPIADVLELIDIATGRVRREPTSMLWRETTEVTETAEESSAKSEPTVLIVDDSITVRELLSMSFNKVGYRVEQARDGQEAWDKLRSGLPCDLVFCDIEMPRMDGLELLSRMQKDSHLKQVPIAMLTSRGADRHRQMAVDLGASGYFTKPYLEEALLDAAQRMLNGEVLAKGRGG